MGNLNCTSAKNSGENYNDAFESSKRRYIQYEKEKFTQIKDKLHCLDKETFELYPKAESILNKLEGYESKDTEGDANENQQTFAELKKEIQDFLKRYLVLQDSYRQLLSDIDTYEEVIEENSDMNYIDPQGQLGNKLKRVKVKETKPMGMGICQPQNKYHVAENDPQKKVQILFTQDGETMRGLVEELQKMLTRNIGTVEFIRLTEKSQVDDNKLMIIVYMVSTRAAADAKSAMENIRNPGNVALVLIHITEPHAVPKHNTTPKLTDQEFENLQCSFYMYYSGGNGLLQCKANENSENGLVSFCKRSPFSEKL